MAKLMYTDEHGTPQSVKILDNLVQILDIPEGKEWDLVTTDDQGTTTTIDFIGGRPNDR